MSTKAYEVSQVKVVTVGARDEQDALRKASLAFDGVIDGHDTTVSRPRIQEVRVARA